MPLGGRGHDAFDDARDAPGDHQMRGQNAVVELRIAEKAELGIDHAQAVRRFQPASRKVVAVDEPFAVGQIARTQRGDRTSVDAIGRQQSRLAGETCRDAVQIEAVRVAQTETTNMCSWFSARMARLENTARPSTGTLIRESCRSQSSSATTVAFVIAPSS